MDVAEEVAEEGMNPIMKRLVLPFLGQGIGLQIQLTDPFNHRQQTIQIWNVKLHQTQLVIYVELPLPLYDVDNAWIRFFVWHAMTCIIGTQSEAYILER